MLLTAFLQYTESVGPGNFALSVSLVDTEKTSLGTKSMLSVS